MGGSVSAAPYQKLRIWESETHDLNLTASVDYRGYSLTTYIGTSRSKIQSLIAEGTTVVIDRYYYSGCVYSAAKQNPSLPLSWCRHPDVGLPRPDLCLFLDISAEAAASRGGYGTEKYEKKEMQDRVRSLFDVLIAGGESGNGEEKDDIVKIDASASLEDVQKKVWEETRRALERVDREERPLRFVEKW